jgi:hypothetical protein
LIHRGVIYVRESERKPRKVERFGSEKREIRSFGKRFPSELSIRPNFKKIQFSIGIDGNSQLQRLL